MPHALVMNGKVYGPNGPIKTINGHTLTVAEAEAYNKSLTDQELAHWSTSPDRFAPAYYTFPHEQAGGPYRPTFNPHLGSATVTTFTGAHLGRIVRARIYRHNFGARMVSITVVGTNGAHYVGRASWDNGSVIRLRKTK